MVLNETWNSFLITELNSGSAVCVDILIKTLGALSVCTLFLGKLCYDVFFLICINVFVHLCTN